MNHKKLNITNKTLYTCPYLVVNDQEYTKHFYAESQRLASKLGAGLASSIVDPAQFQVAEVCSSYEEKSDSLLHMLERGWSCTEIEPGNVSIENPELQVINDLAEVSADEPESDIYFYHSDHLGSSSWITDASGAVNQHLQYLPFGEDYIYQRSNSWNIPYTFSGKEKDSETGYSYFGARYYDSELSVWLRVDPYSDVYSASSPYMYVMGRPIRYIDPNGKWSNLSKAEKARNKAVKKYGEDNVGRIYWDKKEHEYGFRISKDGFKQHRGDEIVKGSAASASESVGIFSKAGLGWYNLKNWKSNAETAGKLTYEWASGTGEVRKTFNNDDVANSFRDAWRVNEARDKFYEQYSGSEDLSGAFINYNKPFHLVGLINAGLDPIEQFVGSYTLTIYALPESGQLMYVITNRTSWKSFTYHHGESYERDEKREGGNTYQQYIFFEPIDYNRLNN